MVLTGVSALMGRHVMDAFVLGSQSAVFYKFIKGPQPAAYQPLRSGEDTVFARLEIYKIVGRAPVMMELRLLGLSPQRLSFREAP